MSRTQFILGRRQTRVEMPNELIGGKTTSGFGMIGGGGNLGTGTKYNFAGQPLVGFNGKPTGYPAIPSGGLNYNDLVWDNPPDSNLPQGAGTVDFLNANNHAMLNCQCPIGAMNNATFANSSIVPYVGPDIVCNLRLNLISYIPSSGASHVTGLIQVFGAAVDPVLTITFDNTPQPPGVTDHPFTIPANADPAAVIFVQYLCTECTNPVGPEPIHQLNFTFELTPAF